MRQTFPKTLEKIRAKLSKGGSVCWQMTKFSFFSSRDSLNIVSSIGRGCCNRTGAFKVLALPKHCHKQAPLLWLFHKIIFFLLKHVLWVTFTHGAKIRGVGKKGGSSQFWQCLHFKSACFNNPSLTDHRRRKNIIFSFKKNYIWIFVTFDLLNIWYIWIEYLLLLRTNQSRLSVMGNDSLKYQWPKCQLFDSKYLMKYLKPNIWLWQKCQ